MYTSFWKHDVFSNIPNFMVFTHVSTVKSIMKGNIRKIFSGKIMYSIELPCGI